MSSKERKLKEQWIGDSGESSAGESRTGFRERQSASELKDPGRAIQNIKVELKKLISEITQLLISPSLEVQMLKGLMIGNHSEMTTNQPLLPKSYGLLDCQTLNIDSLFSTLTLRKLPREKGDRFFTPIILSLF
jgi:mannose-6-phosphate isomerase class I